MYLGKKLQLHCHEVMPLLSIFIVFCVVCGIRKISMSNVTTACAFPVKYLANDQG